MPPAAGLLLLLLLLLFVDAVSTASEHSLCPHRSRWNEEAKKCLCPNETVLHNDRCVPCGSNTHWSEDSCQCFPHHEKISDISCAPIDCAVGMYNASTGVCECRRNFLLDTYRKCTIESCGELQTWDVSSRSCVCVENHAVNRVSEGHGWVYRCVRCGAFTKWTPAGAALCECLPYYEKVSFEPECRVPDCLNGSFDPIRGCVCDDGFVIEETYGKCQRWDPSAEALSAEVAGLRIVNSVANDTRLCLWEDSYQPGAKIQVLLYDCFSFPWGSDRLWIIEDNFGTVLIKKKRIRGVPNLYLSGCKDGTVGATEREWKWASVREQEWTPVKNDDGSWRFRTAHGGWLSSDGNRTLYTTNATLEASLQSFRLELWTENDESCPVPARFDGAADDCRCLPNYVFVKHVAHTHETTYTWFCVPCGASTEWTTSNRCECLPFYERVDAYTCRAPVCPHGSFDPTRGCVCDSGNESAALIEHYEGSGSDPANDNNLSD